METSHLRGRRGESIAAEYLEGSGWTILARNWRDGSREIDLVALRDGVLAFVEVKTRSGGGMGPTLESITRRKRLEIVRAATAWLLTGGGIRGTCGSAHPGRPSFDVVRFDAIAVTLRREGSARVEHVPDAWRVGDH